MTRERIIGELFDFDYVKERYGGDGSTLGSFLAETTNGVDLPLDTPDGDICMVSLAPFAGKNPDHFLVFTFIESDIGFDHLDHGNAVTLGEYDLATERPNGEIISGKNGDAALLKEYELPPGLNIVELKPDQPDQ
jgi:hypothetical protein